MESPLYKNLSIRPCNLLGYLHFQVCSGNVTIGAFMYESDAVRFKELMEIKEKDENPPDCIASVHSEDS